MTTSKQNDNPDAGRRSSREGLDDVAAYYYQQVPTAAEKPATDLEERLLQIAAHRYGSRRPRRTWWLTGSVAASILMLTMLSVVIGSANERPMAEIRSDVQYEASGPAAANDDAAHDGVTLALPPGGIIVNTNSDPDSQPQSLELNPPPLEEVSVHILGAQFRTADRRHLVVTVVTGGHELLPGQTDELADRIAAQLSDWPLEDPALQLPFGGDQGRWQAWRIGATPDTAGSILLRFTTDPVLLPYARVQRSAWAE